jgi:glutathione synthase
MHSTSVSSSASFKTSASRFYIFVLPCPLILPCFRHSIYLIRQTLDELATSATLEEDTKALILVPSFAVLSLSSQVEISIVYFRAGYNPADYPTSTHYATRLLLERSKAIKCPSIAMQLAGSKKVQQVLTKPGVLERFLDETRWGNRVPLSAVAGEIRNSWMEMWGLDEDGPPGEDGVSKVLASTKKLLLKPQRGGCCQDVCPEAIPAFIESLPPRERKAWIAVEVVCPPEGTRNYLVRHGQVTKRSDDIAELGIFGWSLYGADNGLIKEKEVGWLVRTRQRGSCEGGVNSGISVLDSLVLVDE